MNAGACTCATLQPSTTLQGLNAAPVAEFGRSGGFGGFFGFFSYNFLMKGNYRKSLQVSKVSKTLALARVSGHGGFWRVGGLHPLAPAQSVVKSEADTVTRRSDHTGRGERSVTIIAALWVLLGAAMHGAQDREIRLDVGLVAALIISRYFAKFLKLVRQ